MPTSEARARINRDQGLVKRSQTRVAALRRELRHDTALLKKREARLHAERHVWNAEHENHGAIAGVAWGLRQVGVYEQPAFSNSGPQITPWIRAGGGLPGYSWCQYFAAAVLVHGGGEQLASGYTVAVVQWARNGQHGLRVVPAADARLGDFLYYKWPGVSHDFCDHVGVKADALPASNPNAKSLEGNTSPGTSGSQNNGGGVYLHSLQQRRPFLVAVVRPTYR